MENGIFQHQRRRKITTTIFPQKVNKTFRSLCENVNTAIKTQDARKAYGIRKTGRWLHPQPEDSIGSTREKIPAHRDAATARGLDSHRGQGHRKRHCG